jgi:hypothetical protein
MKKIFVIAGLIALLFVLIRPGYAAYNAFDMGNREHFMRVDARDAFNRPVQTNCSFESSSFTEAYSMLTPFGVSRWCQSHGSASPKITSGKTFKVPLEIVSFINNTQRRILSRFSEKIVAVNPIYKIGIFILITLLFLIFEPFLQTGKEPRFRLPILLE